MEGEQKKICRGLYWPTTPPQKLKGLSLSCLHNNYCYNRDGNVNYKSAHPSPGNNKRGNKSSL